MLPEELDELCVARGLESYRSAQILEWLYTHGVRSFDEMTNLPKQMRQKFADECALTDLIPVRVQASSLDDTRKFLLRLRDGNTMEAVLLPEGNRWTACISTQVGCSFGCAFCASGAGGFVRNLTAGEIVAQARMLRFNAEDKRLTNIVFMGMGEPLANYDATAQAVRIFQHPRCMAMGKRRVTISTAGYVPGIHRLAGDTLPVRLAVSLHATDDRLRNRLLPINRKYPIRQLLAACKPLAGNPQTPLTIEYMLMNKVNDSPNQARELVDLCRSLDAKVNLIAYNPTGKGNFAPSPPEQVRQFQSVLRENGILAFVRHSRGLDIDAACGQLRARR
jgi:23S rRNA (adenine2503-C2)-methyltransferase